MSEIPECKACNPQCTKECDECLKEYEEYKRQQDIIYSKNMANVYEEQEGF